MLAGIGAAALGRTAATPAALSAFQACLDSRRQSRADSRDRGHLLHGRLANPLRRSEDPQQGRSPLGAHARQVVER